LNSASVRAVEEAACAFVIASGAAPGSSAAAGRARVAMSAARASRLVVAVVMVVSFVAPIVLPVLAARAHHHEPGSHWSGQAARAFDPGRRNSRAGAN
jgi:hypothetical protein